MRTALPDRIQFRTRYVAGVFGPNWSCLLLSPPSVGIVVFLALAAWAQSSKSLQAVAVAEPPQELSASVPFVGCESDGQAGPMKAPTGKNKLLPIVAGAAQRLAYYKSEQGTGVLAPRGWHCFCVYGSSGSTLYVSPQRIVPANLFSPSWSGFAGEVVAIAGEDGDTSGRFGVARVIARVFPSHRAFVKKVIEEGIEPASSFPFGSYPRDKLVYRSGEIVEYQTPANTDGLGTSFTLKKNANPISGVAILAGDAPDLVLLSVRLSPSLAGLTPTIVQQVERDVMRSVSK